MVNQATIKFDENEPILTNVFENTLDKDVPESQVTALTPKMGGKILVEWAGADNSSGIKHYSVFVQKDDEEIKPWILDTMAVNAEYQLAEKGSTYKFYSICMDSVGYRENTPGDFDAQLVYTAVKGTQTEKENWLIYPNPVREMLHIQLSNAPFVDNFIIELFSMNGQRYFMGNFQTLRIREGIDLPVNNLPVGQYLLRILYDKGSFSEKISIR